MKAQCECGYKVKSHLAADRSRSFLDIADATILDCNGCIALHGDFDLYLTLNLCLEMLLRWWVALAKEEKKDVVFKEFCHSGPEFQGQALGADKKPDIFAGNFPI